MIKIGKHAAELAHRIETRWLIPARAYRDVQQGVAHLLTRVQYSRRTWVRTIYLNNDSHDVPWDLNIKLRRYFDDPVRGAFKLPAGDWVLETKVTTRGDFIQKRKSRHRHNLNAILRRFRRLDALCDLGESHAACPLNLPLRPYLGIEYHREHFIHHTREGYMRVTLDRDTRFWHQLDEGAWIPLGTESGIRFEIKCDPHMTASRLFERLIALLIKMRAVPIISKRYAALNRLTLWQRSLVPMPFYETPRIEYAAIFDVPPALAPTISAELFHLFRHPCQGFILDRTRNWMSEWSMVCIYLEKNKRVNLYGDFSRETREQRYLRLSPYQNIVTRKELKGTEHIIVPTAIIADMEDTAPRGVLMRYKRQFWVRSRSDRVYKVSVNRFFNCATQQYLTGLHLKYAGSATDCAPVEPRVIAGELRALVSIVRTVFPALRPTHQSLRKFACEIAVSTVYPALTVLKAWTKGQHARS